MTAKVPQFEDLGLRTVISLQRVPQLEGLAGYSTWTEVSEHLGMAVVRVGRGNRRKNGWVLVAATHGTDFVLKRAEFDMRSTAENFVLRTSYVNYKEALSDDEPSGYQFCDIRTSWLKESARYSWELCLRAVYSEVGLFPMLLRPCWALCYGQPWTIGVQGVLDGSDSFVARVKAGYFSKNLEAFMVTSLPRNFLWNRNRFANTTNSFHFYYAPDSKTVISGRLSSFQQHNPIEIGVSRQVTQHLNLRAQAIKLQSGSNVGVLSALYSFAADTLLNVRVRFTGLRNLPTLTVGMLYGEL